MGTARPPKYTYAVSPRGQKLLKAAFEKQPLTLEVLARNCGSRKSTLSALMSGRQATLPGLPRLCRDLDVPLVAVLNGVDESAVELLAVYQELLELDADQAAAELRHLRAAVRYAKEKPAKPASRIDPGSPTARR